MPSKDPDSPTLVDRLIAFLHSHFGTVEFLAVNEINLGEEEDKKPSINEDRVEELKPEHKNGYADQAAQPIIRVRLDEHFADVGVEDLVCQNARKFSDDRC